MFLASKLFRQKIRVITFAISQKRFNKGVFYFVVVCGIMKRCYVPDKNARSFLSTLQQQQKNQAKCLLFAWTINVAIITINTWNYYPLLPITVPIIPLIFINFEKIESIPFYDGKEVKGWWGFELFYWLY